MGNTISVTRVLMVSLGGAPGLQGALGSPFLLSWPQVCTARAGACGWWALIHLPVRTVERNILGCSPPMCLSSTGSGLTASPHSAVQLAKCRCFMVSAGMPSTGSATAHAPWGPGCRMSFTLTLLHHSQGFLKAAGGEMGGLRGPAR